MKGRCIGGPLDGQESDRAEPVFHTATFTAADYDIRKPMRALPGLAGTVQNHVYEWRHIAPDVGVWAYRGVQ